MKPQRIADCRAGGMAREMASALKWINRSRHRIRVFGILVSDLSKLGESRQP